MQKVKEFCTHCGTPLVEGACPHGHGREAAAGPKGHFGIGPSAAIVGMVLLLVLNALATYWIVTSDRGRLEDVEGRLNKTVAQERVRSGLLEELSAQVSALRLEVEGKPELTEVADRVLESVFTVETDFGSGTAFVVESSPGESRLLTAYHVVAEAADGLSSVRLRREDQTFDATVEATSILEDLAVLRLEVRFPALALATEEVSPGGTVLVAGSPFGLEGTVSTGVVSQGREREVQFSAPIAPGDSGGPVVNEAGEVVAVMNSKVVGQGAEGLSFGVSIEVACDTVIDC